MRRILIISVILVLTVSYASAQKDDAVYNKVYKSFTLAKDGSQQMNVVTDLTLFTYPSIDTYGETFIVYNPKYQKLVINESYTLQKDGNKVVTPENAFVPSLPSDAADAPAYNGLLEMVIVHTGLEIGATIHLDYTITSSNDYLMALDVFETVEEAAPIKDYRLSITVPKESELNYSVINAGYNVKKSVASDGSKSFVWNIKNVPASSKEQMISVTSGAVPVISANTYVENEDMGGIGLVGDRIIFETPSFIKFSSVEDAVAHIADYFQYIPLSFKDAGFRIRNLNEVVESAYGTEAELTMLLDCILTNMGVNSEVVAAYPVKKYDKSLGLSAISAFFLVTDVPGNELISVSMGKRGISMIPRGFISLRSFEFGKDVPVPSYPSAVVRNEELTLVKSELASFGAGYYLFNLPAESGIASLGIQMFSTRKENILLPYQIDESYCYKIDAGDASLATPAKNLRISNKVGIMEEVITAEGKSISVSRKLKINVQLITPALYPDLKALLQQWTSVDNTTLIFK